MGNAADEQDPTDVGGDPGHRTCHPGPLADREEQDRPGDGGESAKEPAATVGVQGLDRRHGIGPVMGSQRPGHGYPGGPLGHGVVEEGYG